MTMARREQPHTDAETNDRESKHQGEEPAVGAQDARGIRLSEAVERVRTEDIELLERLEAEREA